LFFTSNLPSTVRSPYLPVPLKIDTLNSINLTALRDYLFYL